MPEFRLLGLGVWGLGLSTPPKPVDPKPFFDRCHCLGPEPQFSGIFSAADAQAAAAKSRIWNRR